MQQLYRRFKVLEELITTISKKGPSSENMYCKSTFQFTEETERKYKSVWKEPENLEKTHPGK